MYRHKETDSHAVVLFGPYIGQQFGLIRYTFPRTSTIMLLSICNAVAGSLKVNVLSMETSVST